jgi:hypothetical protein
MGYCPFKKFSNIFGESGKGVHSFKILNTAIVDYLLTILLAFLLAWITNIPVVIMTIIVFIIGIILHILFGVNTNTIKWLRLNC